MKKQFASFLAAGMLLFAVGSSQPAWPPMRRRPRPRPRRRLRCTAARRCRRAALPRRRRCRCTPRRRAAAPLRPSPNKGDTAWMMVATVLVILMTIPGLALFYGGLVRTQEHAVGADAGVHHLRR